MSSLTIRTSLNHNHILNFLTLKVALQEGGHTENSADCDIKILRSTPLKMDENPSPLKRVLSSLSLWIQCGSKTFIFLVQTFLI